ncbi:uncharacterized protein LOC101745476 [Bombyx mori]|uniref:Kinetochore protein SPC25 n=1 Tax=Bombyx mori TaxID=7091 RepID=H9JCI6_BOMMO|nr:uncharacterized protein LOC101745476 [Bombyx mori]BAX35241.1 outer kinetochore Spc25 [Bombyx mori]
MSTFEDDWNFQINIEDIEKKNFEEFEKSLRYINDHVFKLLEETFKTQRLDYNCGTGRSHDEELKLLIDKNKQLRQEVDNKTNEILILQTKYENYKKDQKLLSQEVKETHEAYLLTKKFYKKKLKMYYAIESREAEKETIFIQFFTECKKDPENYSVRLLRNTKLRHYQILQISPKIKIEKELKQKIYIPDDVSALLCCIRQEFLNIKQNKV